MNLLYNIGIAAYVGAIKIAAACGHRKAALMESGRKDWAQSLQLKREKGDHYIWFHAASLGEFEQGRPLIEQLHERYPEYKIIVTFFSPSGYEVRKNYKGADIVCYLPYDKVKQVKTFLDIVQPEIAFFVKYEFWGNILQELHHRHIATYLISGIFRKRQVFFKWYGDMMRNVLKYFSHLFVQDEESRQLLASIGVTNVSICGDTRFDRVLSICAQAKVLPWAERMTHNAQHVLVAGSSWPKDEDILLDHFNRHPEMKLIIAPHEIHEEHIQSIIGKLKRPYMRYSQLDESKLEQTDCIIVDAFGFLSSIYRYGQFAYIGGGFGVGIHNTLEAAVYGIPVMFGPNHTAFREALGLIEAQGAFPISNAAEYESIANRFLSDPSFLKEAGAKAGAYVKDNAGASDAIFSAVFKK